MSPTHFACVRTLLSPTRGDSLVEGTLSETDDYATTHRLGESFFVLKPLVKAEIFHECSNIAMENTHHFLKNWGCG
jgi:hypothetical protein